MVGRNPAPEHPGDEGSDKPAQNEPEKKIPQRGKGQRESMDVPGNGD